MGYLQESYGLAGVLYSESSALLDIWIINIFSQTVAGIFTLLMVGVPFFLMNRTCKFQCSQIYQFSPYINN